MCGILGSMGPPPTLPGDEALRGAIRALRHRGPDAEGVLRSGLAVLGHTRLRVIDLSEAGAQPMRNERGTIWVTYNGEIYNHRALRTELSARGHRFRSRCDTEVLVYGYEEWGDELPQHLDGMFAFAIWDEPRQRLVLCRDRAGEKPLYYHHDPTTGTLRFASEVKALFPLGVPATIRPEGLPLFLSFGYLPAPHTLYDGIMQLPPGCMLIVEPGRPPRMRRYWQARFAQEPSATLSTAAREQVRHLMTEAVRTRLESDVPLGAFLSGGIDSSIIIGILGRILHRPVKTFSIGFADEPRFDETHFARAVADSCGTEHTELIVSPRTLDLARLTEKLVWLHDGPFGDSSAIPTYIVAQLAREHVTVALTGDGGDELFCGYPRLIAAEAAERAPRAVMHALGRIASRLPRGASERSLWSRGLRFLAAAALPLPERVARWNALFLADLPRLLRPEWRHRLDLGEPLSFQQSVFAAYPEGSPLGRVMQHNFVTYLPYDLLIKVDRTAMGHGLETRAPFLATDLIEYASSLPDDYRRKGVHMKRVLLDSFADVLPREVHRRGKMGFGVPLGNWFRQELRSYIIDHMAPGARIYEYLQEAAVRRCLEQHLARMADHSHRLWTLLTLEVWLRALPRWSALPC